MLAPLRRIGSHGTVIDPHRSIATVRLRSGDVLLAIALAVGTTSALLASLGAVGRGWTWMFARLAGPLALGQGVGVRAIDARPFGTFGVPYFNVAAAPPGLTTWWITLVVTVVIVAASFALSDDFLPLAYALRVAALVQATALAFFRIVPERFPYDLQHYISSMMLSGLAMLLVVPVMLGLTFYVIDVGLARKIGLTAAMLGHLLVFIPLQYALQSYIVAHASLLLLPVLFMLFGLLPEVMILIALYGWGMSWPALRTRSRRE